MRPNQKSVAAILGLAILSAAPSAVWGANKEWVGTSSGTWTTGSNWLGFDATEPAAGDSVTFSSVLLPVIRTSVTLNQNRTIASLDVFSPHFIVGPYSFTRSSGAVLTVSHGARFGGENSTTSLNSFSMTSNTLRVESSVTLAIAGSSVISTTGGMTMENSSVLNLSGGSLNLAANSVHNMWKTSTMNVNGGTLNLGANSTLNVNENATLNFSGGYNVTNSTLLRAQGGGDIVGASFIDVGNGGTGFLTAFGAGSSITAQSNVSDWGRGAGSNAVVEFYAGTTSAVSALRVGTVDSQATMRVRGGALTVNSTLEAGGGTASRTVNLTVQDSGTLTLNGTSTFNNQADLDFSSGTLNINQNATVNEGARIDRTGGTMNIASGRKLIVNGGVYADTTTGGQILSSGASIEVKGPFARFGVAQYFDIGNGSLLVESSAQYNSPASAITTDWASATGTVTTATVRSNGRINMGVLRIANSGGATVNVLSNGRIETTGLTVGGTGTSNAIINLNGGFVTVFGIANLGSGAQMTLNDPVGNNTALGQVTQFLVDGTLNMTGNAALFTEGESPAIVVDALSMTGNSRILMQPGAEISINYGAASAPLNTIRGYILSGFNNGAWNGSSGISSSAAQLDARLGVGYVNFPDAQFGSMTVKLTLQGDADLSGAVGFPDLLALARNYNGTGRFWADGDFNYDGNVGFSDLLALARNYNQSLSLEESASLGESFASDWSLARSLVPEPSIITSLLGTSAVLLGRRRRSPGA